MRSSRADGKDTSFNLRSGKKTGNPATMRLAGYLLAAALLAACSTTRAPIETPGIGAGPATQPAPPVATPSQPEWRPPVPTVFGALPGWGESALLPGVLAFQKSCEVIERRPADGLLSDAAPWAGRVDDWLAGWPPY